MRSELFHSALFELLKASPETEVLKKRTSEEQNQNQQIEIEDESENRLVFLKQNIVRLWGIDQELVQFVEEPILKPQNFDEPDV